MDEKQFLGKRRDRCIATILGEKERLCDKFLPDDVSYEFRKIILDEINAVVDLAFDLVASAGDVVYNELYFDKLDEKLEEIYSEILVMKHGSTDGEIFTTQS